MTIVTLKLIIGSTAAQATTVYFNDADRGPAGTLQIDGVTIIPTASGLPLGTGQPTTVQGVGLGLDGEVGPAGVIDEQAYFPSNASEFSSLTGGGGLSFHVDGWINSITIQPVLESFSGSGNLLSVPDDVMMEFSLVEGGPLNYWPVIPANPSAPVTLSSSLSEEASTWYLTPQLNQDPSVWYSSCRTGYLSEDQTLQWGFSVVSLDYTPVPEPATTTFLAMGLIGLLCARTGRWSWRKKLCRASMRHRRWNSEL